MYFKSFDISVDKNKKKHFKICIIKLYIVQILYIFIKEKIYVYICIMIFSNYFQIICSMVKLRLNCLLFLLIT